MHARRFVLAGASLIVCALCVRRAHALRDPNELSLGGSGGVHDEALACGPTVRVRNVSAGARYEHVWSGETKGEGLVLDLRGGAGTSTVTTVGPQADDTSAQEAIAEKGRPIWSGSAQAIAGWSGGSFAIAGGGGAYGVVSLGKPNYKVLPAIDLRIGRRVGLSTRMGLGAPPFAPLARFYSAYLVVGVRTPSRIAVHGGLVATAGELAIGGGPLLAASFPLAPEATVDLVGMLAARPDAERRIDDRFGYTVGVGITVTFDGGARKP